MPEPELWRNPAASAGERELLKGETCGCFHCLARWVQWHEWFQDVRSHTWCASLWFWFCLLESIVWCVVSSQAHGEQSALWFFDLYPNCLEMSSLKDKVNPVSGAVLKQELWGGGRGPARWEKRMGSFSEIKARPRNKGCRNTKALCTRSTSAVIDEPSPMAAIKLVIFYSWVVVCLDEIRKAKLQITIMA